MRPLPAFVAGAARPGPFHFVALLGAIAVGCSSSPSESASSTTTSSTSTTSASTGAGGGTTSASTTSTTTSATTSGAGGSGGASSTTGAGGSGGAGGAPVDPCVGAPVPGSLAGSFRLGSGDVFDVGDTHVYVLQTNDNDCPAQVLRFPKGGGPTEVIASYASPSDTYEGRIQGESFYWIASFRLYSVPLAGGAPAEVAFIQGSPSYQIAVNATHAFAAQSGGGFTIRRVPLAGGPMDSIDSFSAVQPYFDLAADEGAFYRITSKELVGIPLPSGAPITLASGSLGSDVAIDDAYVYFKHDSTLSRVPKAGGAVTPLVTLDANEAVEGLAVDATHLYWSDGAGKAIHKVAKAGGPEELVASTSSAPSTVRVDDTSVYWASRSDGAIWKAAK
jgi:hypothetical protein